MKIKKTINLIVETFLVIFLLICSSGTIYIMKIIAKTKNPSVNTIIEGSSSSIIDSKGNNIITLNLSNINYAEYFISVFFKTTKKYELSNSKQL